MHLLGLRATPGSFLACLTDGTVFMPGTKCSLIACAASAISSALSALTLLLPALISILIHSGHVKLRCFQTPYGGGIPTTVILRTNPRTSLISARMNPTDCSSTSSLLWSRCMVLSGSWSTRALILRVVSLGAPRSLELPSVLAWTLPFNVVRLPRTSTLG